MRNFNNILKIFQIWIILSILINIKSILTNVLLKKKNTFFLSKVKSDPTANEVN
jgi:hypothetical protein